MIKITGAKDYGKVITMSEMKTLEIGTICEVPNGIDNKGHLVMRTASTQNFEVMDLTNFGEDHCWSDRQSLTNIKVFIPAQSEFNLTISNKK